MYEMKFTFWPMYSVYFCASQWQFAQWRTWSNDFRELENRELLCNVFTLTRKTLDFKHASQKREERKYTKEDEDICTAVA